MSATRMFERFRKLLDVDWTNIGDGQFLKRQGTLINGGTPSGGGSAELPPGYLFGLTLSNNATDATNDIDVGPGECRDIGDTVDMVLASLITKRLDATWVVGTGQGGLDTGVVANTTYHVFLIKRTDTGIVDVLFSLSSTAPTMPTGYTFKRRVGSIMRVGGIITPFTQKGDEFLRKLTAFDVNVVNLGNTAVLYTLSVPTGIQVGALISIFVYNTVTTYGLLTSPDQTDIAPSSSTYFNFLLTGSLGQFVLFNTRTNTSAQIRARADTANTTLYISTVGWIDTRDKPMTGGGSVVVEAATYPRSHLVGLGLSNNATDATNDIDVAEGECRDSTNVMNMVLPSAITKRLDAAWVVGTNQGGLDTGAIADTTYHVFVIKRSDTGVVDVLFSTSPTAPTLPANYSHFRRVGSIRRAAGAIVAFAQRGDEFLLRTPVTDVNVGTLGASGTLYVLSVPTGIQVNVMMNAFAFKSSASVFVLITSPDQNDVAVAFPLISILTVSTVTGHFPSGGITIRTNVSGQIRARADVAGVTFILITHGWIDTRGRGN